MNITDYTNNGVCSRCGSCCSNYLPMTRRELKTLRLWVKKHRYVPPKLSPVFADTVLDGTCPFWDKASKACVCYDIRPEICRRFLCHTAKTETIKLDPRRYMVHDLRKELFGQDTVDFRDWQALLEYIRGKSEGGSQ